MSVLIAGLPIISGDSSSITEILLAAIFFLDTANVLFIDLRKVFPRKLSAAWQVLVAGQYLRNSFPIYPSALLSGNPEYKRARVKSCATVSASLSFPLI